MSWHEGLQIAFDNERGRHVKATRDIRPGGSRVYSQVAPLVVLLRPVSQPNTATGELLLSEDCAAAMVFRDAALVCCSACVKPLVNKALKCEKCRIESYCSEVCMDAARRAYHSSEGECAIFEAALEVEETERREKMNESTPSQSNFHFDDVPQRFLVRVLSQAGKWRADGEPMTCQDVEALRALQAHIPEQNSTEHARLSAISRNTLRLMGEPVDQGVVYKPTPPAIFGTRGEEETTAPCSYGVAQLTQLMCSINCNSHTLYCRERWPLEPVGTAVYLQGSAFNHSCCPTAEFYNIGTSLQVRSIQPIRAGQEVCVSYVPLTQSLTERRLSLSSQFKFTCSCERCQLEELENLEKGGRVIKRIKREDADEPLSLLILEHLGNLSSRDLTNETGVDTAEADNARRALIEIREACGVHEDAFRKVEYGSEPVLRLLHIVEKLDRGLSASPDGRTAANMRKMKAALLERALAYAVVARGDEHPLSLAICAAVSL